MWLHQYACSLISGNKKRNESEPSECIILVKMRNCKKIQKCKLKFGIEAEYAVMNMPQQNYLVEHGFAPLTNKVLP